MSRMRDADFGSFCRRSASSIECRVSSHSIGSSKLGSAKPGPAGRPRGLFRYSSYASQAVPMIFSISASIPQKAGS